MNYRDLAHQIQRLQPGQRIEVSGHILRDMEPLGVFATFRTETAADSVLENIVGSSYEFWYEENPMTGNTTFGRLKAPLDDGRRSYVSPDRRHHYQREGRLYRPVNEGAEQPGAQPPVCSGNWFGPAGPGAIAGLQRLRSGPEGLNTKLRHGGNANNQ